MSSHSLSDITTTVKNKLDTKLNRTDEAASVQWDNVSNRPSTYNPSSHRHSWNDIDNKPSIPGSPKAYITETWRSGNNWYRKYNDGWIEQGGFLGVQSGANLDGNNTTGVSLNTPFTNANYIISITTESINGNEVDAISTYRHANNSSFKLVLYDKYNVEKSNARWYACGY